jgi:hypothetical protein
MLLIIRKGKFIIIKVQKGFTLVNIIEKQEEIN